MIIVFDLDGVLADNQHRLHFITGTTKDYDAFYQACGEDQPIPELLEVIKQFILSGHQVEIWTGRYESSRFLTEGWLTRHGLHGVAKLRMRIDSDHCKSDVLKERWLDSCFPCEWPQLVFEDSSRNTAMYRRRGIRCLQVVEDEFKYPSGIP